MTFPATDADISDQCLNISIIDDTYAEDYERFELEISSTSPSNAQPQNIVTTEVTIQDDDCKFRISNPN